MATKSFNDICVEYAHQLGKGLPLTAPEMCNAVIMYLNQQVDVMNQYVQTALNAVKDLQTEIADIDLSDYVTLNTDQTINGEKTFTDSQFFNKGLTANGGKISGKTLVASDSGSGTSPSRVEILYNQISNIKNGITYRQTFQDKNGAIALTSDIPDLDNYTGIVHIAQGTAGSGIAVHDTAKASPYTKYGYDKIETYGNSNTLRYTLNIPNKNGTIATLEDIGSSSDTKYFTRVIFHDSNTLYIFSCITNDDLSGNNVYDDIVSLLFELGATSPYSALPCSGKKSSGDTVIGVYTDGSEITVVGVDNDIEVIPTSAEINVISK